MTAKYWIKLWHEILHDKKMATLEDRLWRRTIECFLFAGEIDQEGYLPSLSDMAWILRTTDEQLETDLNELIRIGILEHRDGTYFVRNFEARQAKLSKAEYNRRRREERKRGTYYQDDTEPLPSRYQSVTNGNTEENRIDKIRREKKGAAAATAFSNSGFGDNHHDKCAKAYTEITGQFSIPSSQYDMAIGYLSDVLDYYGDDWRLMVEEGKRTFATWCARKTKGGKPYSPLNIAWIETWLSKLVPLPSSEPEMVILEPEFDPDQQAEIRARMKAMAEDKSR